jgi:hypothetical protein
VIPVTLTKIKSNHNNLSLDVYHGYAYELPELGRSFVLHGTEEGEVWTTRVISFEKNFETGTITFKTKNSEYKVEPIK